MRGVRSVDDGIRGFRPNQGGVSVAAIWLIKSIEQSRPSLNLVTPLSQYTLIVLQSLSSQVSLSSYLCGEPMYDVMLGAGKLPS
jgi:hypothetical protein